MAVQQEEGLSHFGRFLLGTEAVSAHLALAVAGHPMGIQRQKGAGEMSSGTAQLAQGNLGLLGVLEGMAVQEVVNGRVGRNEGQAVGQFEAFLRERAALATKAQA
jgi:hypothetical protein